MVLFLVVHKIIHYPNSCSGGSSGKGRSYTVEQRILEHLEWKLPGDFFKSKTIQDGKKAL